MGKDESFFMQQAYHSVGGQTLKPGPTIWEVGDRMGWDRGLTQRVYERLSRQHGLLSDVDLGTFVLTMDGLIWCERQFGTLPAWETKRKRWLEAVYDAAGGSTDLEVDGLVEADRAGLCDGDAQEIAAYLGHQELIELTQGQGVRLLPRGIDLVERSRD